MSRRVLVLDGPHAGKWVPDYGPTCQLLEPMSWSFLSSLDMYGPEDRLYYRRLYVALLDGVYYVREGYSLWATDEHVPHIAILAITAEALLSS